LIAASKLASATGGAGPRRTGRDAVLRFAA
jgi:hypothetical protein